MEKRMRICYYDRAWYDIGDKAVHEDKENSSEDAPDSRMHIRDYDKLLDMLTSWFDDPLSEWESGNGVDEGFTIYEVVVADAVYDEEDLDIDCPDPEEDVCLWNYRVENCEVKEVVLGIRESEITDEVRKTVEEYYAAKEGVLSEKVVFHYRKEEYNSKSK